MHSYELRFRVPKSSVKNLVGKGGANISKIKQAHDIRVDFIDFEDPDDSEEVEAQLEGTREGCYSAKAAILEAIDMKVYFLILILV